MAQCKTCGKEVGCPCNLDKNGNCSKCASNATKQVNVTTPTVKNTKQ
jgi:hypothetical protein